MSNDIVTGLDIFVSDDWGIGGIQLTFSNGDQSMVGGHTENVKSIQFHSNERVTSLSLWGDGTGDHLGYIYLETDQGNTLSGGKDVSDLGTPRYTVRNADCTPSPIRWTRTNIRSMLAAV